ncbi:MAG: DNA topoisomerase IV subunit A, partial [Verrucomicrobia bacterium]|nr:DNA topoisomerase IV subunit A [Verrucomicrobiota bacterium]
HPHGDASIGDAIVVLTQKGYLIEGQGNFGNIYTGDDAAAPRYTECRLTELARTQLFNDELTRFIPSYDGRKKEPVTLPSKIPLLLMMGAEGIAVGLSTSILPHNFNELIEAQIAILQNKPFELLPDFQTGGLMDAGEYARGFGKVRVRAVIEEKKGVAGTLVIRELPWGVTTHALIESIEDAARKKKIRVSAIDDFTAERVEVEVRLQKGEDVHKAIAALYHFTSCERSISVRPIVIRQDRPVELGVDEILRANTAQLTDILEKELQLKAAKLREEIHAKSLARIFIENRIYKDIEKCTTYEAVQKAVLDGVNKFRKELRRDVTLEDVEMLLGLRIKRISLFDLAQNRREIADALAALAQAEDDLQHLKRYAVAYLKALLKSYGKQYPRRTRIVAFEETNKRDLAVRNLPIAYDKVRGYLGTDVKGEGIEVAFKCSELDRILIVHEDGRYRVVAPTDKLFVDRDVLHFSIYDREQPFLALYGSRKDSLSFVKKFAFGGAILDKEYRCIPEKMKLHFFSSEIPQRLYVKYREYKLKDRQRKPPPNARGPEKQTLRLEDLPLQNPKTRGNELSGRDIDEVKLERPRGWPEGEGESAITPLLPMD